MECENGYYKKIVYKKSAFEDLKTYLKLHYNNKNICIISTKSIPSEETTKLINAVLCGSEKVSHFVSINDFTLKEIEKFQNKIKNGGFDLLISFGGGKCCDVVKYFADVFKLPYIVCPTSASSIAYFSSYCVNPIDSNNSFYASEPKKIFIQESVIKSSNCNLNINGLCFLHSLRAVYLEACTINLENERYILAGLEKLFKKLESEQTNILLCNEDSNLVLMDLLIDFGFFIEMLGKDYYLFKCYEVYNHICNMKEYSYCGRVMLLCAKTVMSILKGYIELNSVKIFEMPNFREISDLLEKEQISYKNIKNSTFFYDFMKKVYVKKEYFELKEGIYKLICSQILKINEFCNRVKSVYKYGINIEEEYKTLTNSIKITPYIYSGTNMINLMVGSGILNCL